MGNDCERAATRDFLLQGGTGSGVGSERHEAGTFRLRFANINTQYTETKVGLKCGLPRGASAVRVRAPANGATAPKRNNHRTHSFWDFLIASSDGDLPEKVFP